MRRRDTSSGDAFGPGTDLIVSLFAIMTCLFAFVAIRNASANANLQRSESELEDAKAEEQAAQNSARKFESSLKAQQATLASLRQKLQTLEKDAAKHKDLADALLAARKDIERLTSELKAQEANLQHANELTQAQSDSIASLRKQLTAILNQKKSLEAVAKNLRAKLDRSARSSQQAESLAKRLADAAAARKRADARLASLQAQLASVRSLLSQKDKQLSASIAKHTVFKQSSAAASRARATAEQQLRQEILEIKGQLRHVVFVVDASGSMADSGRWQQAHALINNWLRYLPVENASLIVFNDKFQIFPAPNKLLPMTDRANRRSLVQNLAKFEPQGGTSTLKALEAAYRFQEVDTIILFTDGKPDDGITPTARLVDEILSFVTERKNRRIAINTVGLGDYFSSDTGRQSDTFRLLVGLAELTGGSFRGR